MGGAHGGGVENFFAVTALYVGIPARGGARFAVGLLFITERFMIIWRAKRRVNSR